MTLFTNEEQVLEELQKLNRQLQRRVSWQFNLGAGILRGIGYALGAGIIASVVYAIITAVTNLIS